jgi:tetratricopeptide (TPR) repeat protein
VVPAAEFAAIALFAGRLNRLLARWSAANTCYARAEDAAMAGSDMVTVLRSRLGRSGVMRGQGNLPLALCNILKVADEAGQLGLTEIQAMAYADCGAVYSLQGAYDEMVTANYRAFTLSEDSIQRMRVLGDLGIGLLNLKAFESARLAFEIVAESNTSLLVRTNALLELMDLESRVGNRLAFERRRSEGEALRERMPPSMTADFLYKAGTGLARFGRQKRAQEILQAGLRLSEEHHLNAWYFKFERELVALETSDQSATTETIPTTPAPFVGSPAVEEVAMGLREYALAAN